MTQPTILADLDAGVVGNVQKFAATSDVRYYLCGVHVTESRGGDNGDVPARIEGTNGHMLYTEEDRSGIAVRELIIKISKRGHSLLRHGHRVKVYEGGALHITNESGAVLYVEPDNGLIDAKFPVIENLVGVPTDWHEGLIAPCAAKYLKKVMSLPGYVRFFSKKDADGNFSYSSSVMFLLDGGTLTGGKAMGLIMPIRTQFGPGATVADMMPSSLLARRGPAKAAA